MAPTEPTVTTIVSTYLRLGGYDGLCREECGCGLEDLAVCGEACAWSCRPAYRWTCSESCPRRQVSDRYDPEECVENNWDDNGCWRSTRQEAT